MTFYSVPTGEQETTISFSRDERFAIVWTNDRTMITKLDRMCEKSPENYECIDTGCVLDKRYRINDKGLISFRSGRIQLTEEQRKQRADAARRALQSR